MNKTKIEWCDYTWNPVTGCLHGCEYCYARRFAKRNLQGNCDFKPTFYKSRLDQPAKIKKPSRVFVVSMGDLFGEWVPDEWIERVFEACEKAPWHTYYFLTKHPVRYLNVDYSLRWWMGFSASYGEQYIRQILNMPETCKRFASIEPILGEVRNIQTVDWLIVGSETRNSRPVNVPEKKWILEIREQCRNRNIPLFEKNSLAVLDLPGGLIQEWPE